MKYLVLARENLTNEGDGRALRNKMTRMVCIFLFEDVIYKYGFSGKVWSIVVS